VWIESIKSSSKHDSHPKEKKCDERRRRASELKFAVSQGRSGLKGKWKTASICSLLCGNGRGGVRLKPVGLGSLDCVKIALQIFDTARPNFVAGAVSTRTKRCTLKSALQVA
jgi:hypothetical protein